MINLQASPGFYAQTTCLTGYARTPSFERSGFGSQNGASLLLFFFGCTQCHERSLPAKPRDHTLSHTEVAPQSALLINGTSFPIQIHITLQVNLMICLILEPIINYTLQVPYCMLCNHKVNMSQCVHSKENI